jgi:hypothetical protein
MADMINIKTLCCGWNTEPAGMAITDDEHRAELIAYLARHYAKELLAALAEPGQPITDE